MQKISSILCLLNTLILPCLYDLTRDRVFFVFCFTICLFVLLLTLLKLKFAPLPIRLIIGLIITLIYKRNFLLFFNIIFSVYTSSTPEQLRNRLISSYGHAGRIYDNFSELNPKPHIILMNYCSDRLESALPLIFPKPFAFFMRKAFYKTFQMKYAPIHCFYREDGNSYESTKNQIENIVKTQNKYVILYANLSPYIHPANGGKIRSGIFNIAKELGIPISLMALDYVDTYWGCVWDQPIQIKIGPYFENITQDNLKSIMNQTRIYFRDTLKRFIYIKQFLK
jgi:hypothetical protein